MQVPDPHEIPPCDQCHLKPAVLYCETCEVALCDSSDSNTCFRKVHKQLSMREHKHIPIAEYLERERQRESDSPVPGALAAVPFAGALSRTALGLDSMARHRGSLRAGVAGAAAGLGSLRAADFAATFDGGGGGGGGRQRTTSVGSAGDGVLGADDGDEPDEEDFPEEDLLQISHGAGGKTEVKIITVKRNST